MRDLATFFLRCQMRKTTTSLPKIRLQPDHSAPTEPTPTERPPQVDNRLPAAADAWDEYAERARDGWRPKLWPSK